MRDLTIDQIFQAKNNNESLECINFGKKDLRGCNFSEADLRGCNFSEADLRHCNFTEADLTNVEGITCLELTRGRCIVHKSNAYTNPSKTYVMIDYRWGSLEYWQKNYIEFLLPDDIKILNMFMGK